MFFIIIYYMICAASVCVCVSLCFVTLSLSPFVIAHTRFCSSSSLPFLRAFIAGASATSTKFSFYNHLEWMRIAEPTFRYIILVCVFVSIFTMAPRPRLPHWHSSIQTNTTSVHGRTSIPSADISARAIICICDGHICSYILSLLYCNTHAHRHIIYNNISTMFDFQLQIATFRKKLLANRFKGIFNFPRILHSANIHTPHTHGDIAQPFHHLVLSFHIKLHSAPSLSLARAPSCFISYIYLSCVWVCVCVYICLCLSITKADTFAWHFHNIIYV